MLTPERMPRTAMVGVAEQRRCGARHAAAGGGEVGDAGDVAGLPGSIPPVERENGTRRRDWHRRLVPGMARARPIDGDSGGIPTVVRAGRWGGLDPGKGGGKRGEGGRRASRAPIHARQVGGGTGSEGQVIDTVKRRPWRQWRCCRHSVRTTAILQIPPFGPFFLFLFYFL